MKKAVILISGGLDSATISGIAKAQNFELYGLSFDYGQRHKIELESARKIADFFLFKEHKIAEIDLRIFGKSALTADIAVPKSKFAFDKNQQINGEIPVTYVPARNTIFLSYCLAYCEVINAFDIFIGVNAVDYSGYPDCRKEYISAFTSMANLACASTINSQNQFTLHTPLSNMDKKTIILNGLKLGVDYSLTHSCYDPEIIEDKVYSCGQCDSCRIRIKGFGEANSIDKILYR
jgi:7-cyano-7-deazaguanine synthase